MSLARFGSPDSQGNILPVGWDYLSTVATSHDDEICGQSLSLTIARSPTFTWARFVPFPTEILYAHWYFCQQTFHDVTSTSGGLAVGRIVQEPLTPVRNETIVPAGTNITSSNPRYTRLIYRANSTGQEYSMTKRAGMAIMNHLSSLLTVNHLDYDTGCVIVDPTGILSMSQFLGATDLANMTRNIAATLSAQIQSSSPGDNENSTLVRGDAFISETYILVRWPWLTLMFLEGAGTVVLLAITIVKTRGQPLVKSSIIAPLMYGLKGWEDEPDYTSAGVSDSSPILERRAKQMSACLGEQAGGQVRFVKWA